MTATTDVARPGPGARLGLWYYALHPGYLLLIRWSLITVLTLVAFWTSIVSLVQTSLAGGLGGYVWTVPMAGILVAMGVTRRHRTELPIHDRQTDVIVGMLGLVMALLVKGVLIGRYALYFHLLRLDLLALWLYVLSAGIILFGLRPTARFALVWLMMLMVFALPYYVAVAILGGGKVAAGAVSLSISAVGTWIALGRTFRRGLSGSIASWVVGGMVLSAMAVLTPDAPLLAFQQIPALTTICVVGGGFYWFARRGEPKHVLDRKVEPLAARQVWASVPIVAVIGIALAVMPLPPPVGVTAITRDSPRELALGQPMIVPSGWHATAGHRYDWVHRLYGSGAKLVRQQMMANSGNPRWDKLGQPRTVVVDTITTRRPYSFNVYPARFLYNVAGSRISASRSVDLGFGVTGQIFTVIDDILLITWNRLEFTWGNDQIAQRVDIFAIDNHDPGTWFPEPAPNVLPTLNSLITVLLRGEGAGADRAPKFKDLDLLTTFGRALIVAQGVPG